MFRLYYTFALYPRIDSILEEVLEGNLDLVHGLPYFRLPLTAAGKYFKQFTLSVVTSSLADRWDNVQKRNALCESPLESDVMLPLDLF